METKKKKPAAKASGGKTARKPSQGQAAAKKRAAGKQAQAAGKKRAQGAGNARGDKMRTPVFCEILLWAMLAFCVILFFCNTIGMGGSVTGALGRFCFGVFGVLGYAFPILLFLATAFLVANRGSGLSWAKTAAASLLFACVCAMVELSQNQFDPTRTFADYFEAGSTLRAGGGVFGSLLCRVFCPIFGTVGAFVCLIALMLIGMVVVTERSLFDNLRKNSQRAYQRVRQDSSEKREMHQLKRERSQLEKRKRLLAEVEQLRQEVPQDIPLPDARAPRRAKKVFGVSKDTTFDPALPSSEELHEILPKASAKATFVENIENRKIEDGKTKGQPGALTQFEGDAGILEEENWKGAADSAGHETAVGATVAARPDAASGEFASEEFASAVDARKAGVQETTLGEGDARDAMRNVAATGVGTAGVATQDAAVTDAVSAGVAAQDAAVTDAVSAGIAAQDVAVTGMGDISFGNAQISAASGDLDDTERESDYATAVDPEDALDGTENRDAAPQYRFPSTDLLSLPKSAAAGNDREVRETAAKLQQTLHNFGVRVTVTNVSCGPSVTRYELTPEQGVKVSRIVSLADDIKLNLAAADIRIEAPIPGKAAVGIEVPNKENNPVFLRELLESDAFRNSASNLTFAVGKDIAGKVVVADIAKMPHLLIAGATGSGKSVCINTLIMSILYKADPKDVKLIMIDPKVVELSVYNGIPHLFIPVVTDPKKASAALNWGVAEMTDRYQKFASCGVRDLKGYNERVAALDGVEGEEKPQKLPQIVIIVDELADLMMVAPGEVEDSICRLAQLARAAGIHLILATQRPSVNVITGLIKANMPSRIAFSVSSGVDSRTIIDMNGAEKLLGKGDMLFYPQGYQKPARVQGAFVSDEEVGRVTQFLTRENENKLSRQEMDARISQVQQASAALPGSGGGDARDSKFEQAGRFIIEKEKASIGNLQRVFKVGFNRAARIMDQLADAGVVGPEEGTKPRKILMTMEEFERYLEETA